MWCDYQCDGIASVWCDYQFDGIASVWYNYDCMSMMNMARSQAVNSHGVEAGVEHCDMRACGKLCTKYHRRNESNLLSSGKL